MRFSAFAARVHGPNQVRELVEPFQVVGDLVEDRLIIVPDCDCRVDRGNAAVAQRAVHAFPTPLAGVEAVDNYRLLEDIFRGCHHIPFSNALMPANRSAQVRPGQGRGHKRGRVERGIDPQ